jgi:hypothetical protein
VADLAQISRRRLIQIGLLTTTQLVLSPSNANAAIGTCDHGGQPCDNCRRQPNIPLTLPLRPRTINPWLTPKVL